MGDTSWKRLERRVAAYFGASRIIGSGGLFPHLETRSDSNHPRLYVEAKYRQRHAALTLWRATLAKAKREGKRPVVALAEKGRKGFWLLVHSSDLEAVAAERRRARVDEYVDES